MAIKEETYLNLHRGLGEPLASVRGTYVRFDNLQTERSEQRRAQLQAVVSRLVARGMDCCVVHGQGSEFDLLLLYTGGHAAQAILAPWKGLGPVLAETDKVGASALEKGWQQRIRIHLERQGFTRVGSDRYVQLKDVHRTQDMFKRGFRVQALLSDDHPALYVDPRSRVMEPIDINDVLNAEGQGGESQVKVRVLPRWSPGILQGRVGRKAKEIEFQLGTLRVSAPDYWRLKNNITFVSPEEEMVEIYLGAAEKTFEYPMSCVFREFERGTPIPEDLKKDPTIRVRESSGFIRANIAGITFLGRRQDFQGPTSTTDLGYHVFRFPGQDGFMVEVGGGTSTSIQDLHGALKRHGPFAGSIDGKYVVVHGGMDPSLRMAFDRIASTYGSLGCGKLRRLTSIGQDGFIDTGGVQAADFTSAITQVRGELDRARERLLAFVVLPTKHASAVYFKARDKFFERLFGLAPVPVQAVADETLSKILARGQLGYYSQVNIASQVYVKMGGTGAACWVLAEAADAVIPGISPGSSCYAYHDVSRRPRMKASATAYSAMTDAYGRYIATGSRPTGGETLTPTVFYDILVDLLEKVSLFGQRFGSAGRKKFSLERLVFAKDGVIHGDEADMMESVIVKGIPEEGKEPIPSLLKRIQMLPKSLIIDVIDVNKNPNKRMFMRGRAGYANVREGTAAAVSDSRGLLVSCPTFRGTCQPLEITLWKHLCLNRPESPRPHIASIMEEYYHMTYLDWASVFRQGKYALPQILTQNLGEHISAGVSVPEDMVLL